MQVDVREMRGVHVVSVRGELDLLTSVVFFNQVVELRRRAGVKIVLDLGGLTYLDSVGTGQLWKTVEATRAEAGDAVLAAVPPFARKTLDLVGISGQVVMADTVEDAVRALAP